MPSASPITCPGPLSPAPRAAVDFLSVIRPAGRLFYTGSCCVWLPASGHSRSASVFASFVRVAFEGRGLLARLSDTPLRAQTTSCLSLHKGQHVGCFHSAAAVSTAAVSVHARVFV